MRKSKSWPMISAIVWVIASFSVLLPATADAPPVRIGVVPGGGSGIEQEAVDRISSQLQNTPSVVLSTVNPDWYVVCNVQERTDQSSGQIRYNGSITVKTTDGQVISSTAVQKYNQDFSLQPGAQLNKALVDSAARDVISGMSERAMPPLQQAIQVEIDTRERVINASRLADGDKFDEAMALLAPISPDSTHFKQVRGLISQFAVEKHCLELMTSSEAKAKQGKYSEAITLLKDVDKHSKRYKLAQQKIATYKAALSHKSRLARNKQSGSSTPSTASELQKLEQKRKALQAQDKAIQSEEAAIKSQTGK